MTTSSQTSIEVLCATMGQSDLPKLDEMGIVGCNVTFANQAERFAYDETIKAESVVRMLTTATTGVGKNRNFALALASGDILLFADDDLAYEPDAAKTVAEAFERFPSADVIVFGIRYAKDGAVFKSRVPQTGRLSFFKALKYGTCAIAVRRSSVLKYNLRFSELFGGGCLYSYGEDTDFIVQCFKKHLKVYSYQVIIATTSKDSSTCFAGFGKKFFFDRGALARHSLGLASFPYMLRMAAKDLETDLGFFERLAYLWRGYASFPTLTSFDVWTSEHGHEEDSHR